MAETKEKKEDLDDEEDEENLTGEEKVERQEAEGDGGRREEV